MRCPLRTFFLVAFGSRFQIPDTGGFCQVITSPDRLDPSSKGHELEILFQFLQFIELDRRNARDDLRGPYLDKDPRPVWQRCLYFDVEHCAVVLRSISGNHLCRFEIAQIISPQVHLNTSPYHQDEGLLFSRLEKENETTSEKMRWHRLDQALPSFDAHLRLFTSIHDFGRRPQHGILSSYNVDVFTSTASHVQKVYYF